MDLQGCQIMDTITAKQIAERLDGRQYGEEITESEKVLANEFNLVVVFAYSDDNVELRGAVDGEFSAPCILYFDKSGVIQSKCECGSDCVYFQEKIEGTAKITAHWCRDGFRFPWEYETSIPHHEFKIYDGGKDEPFCRGIVFSLDDVEAKRVI